jgi:nicotinamidase/pyrazinamidase
MKVRALLVIDLQRDFVDPGGVLYFEGAEKVTDYAVKLVEEFKEKGLPIITTQDWHDENDKEFEVWPKHCVAGSEGARLTEKLEKSLEGYEKHYSIKKTRFSAFYKTNFDDLISELGIDEFEVVGVVTNICVMFTVEEIRNRDIPVKVHEKGVTSYDEELHKCALRQMKEVLGAEIV